MSASSGLNDGGGGWDDCRRPAVGQQAPKDCNVSASKYLWPQRTNGNHHNPIRTAVAIPPAADHT